MRFTLLRPAVAATAAAIALAFPLCTLCQSAFAAPVANPLERDASTAVQAEGRVLLGLARAGTRLVAVGERGLILLSDDDGTSWRQAKVPVAVTLTAARFPTPKSGWAVGHAGIVLHTVDGGETWARQLDGKAVTGILTEAAKASGSAQMSAVAQQFAGDGPDKPFLDLHFQDERHGILVGAYGLVLRTEDAGKTWQPMMDRIENPKGLHIYAIAVRGDSIWLAGEQGFLAHSADGGKTFARIETPYRGSYFTLAALQDGGIVFGGLKGNAFRSIDGARFEKVEGFIPVSLSASAVLADGKVLFSNQAGQLFVSGDQAHSVRAVSQFRAAPLAAVAQAANGNIVVAGVRGVAIVPGNVISSGGGK
jgi:photosystem II stability/assembly factor-like uncharacterized protein